MLDATNEDGYLKNLFPTIQTKIYDLFSSLNAEIAFLIALCAQSVAFHWGHRELFFHSIASRYCTLPDSVAPTSDIYCRWLTHCNSHASIQGLPCAHAMALIKNGWRCYYRRFNKVLHRKRERETWTNPSFNGSTFLAEISNFKWDFISLIYIIQQTMRVSLRAIRNRYNFTQQSWEWKNVNKKSADEFYCTKEILKIFFSVPNYKAHSR